MLLACSVSLLRNPTVHSLRQLVPNPLADFALSFRQCASLSCVLTPGAVQYAFLYTPALEKMSSTTGNERACASWSSGRSVMESRRRALFKNGGVANDDGCGASAFSARFVGGVLFTTPLLVGPSVTVSLLERSTFTVPLLRGSAVATSFRGGSTVTVSVLIRAAGSSVGVGTVAVVCRPRPRIRRL